MNATYRIVNTKHIVDLYIQNIEGAFTDDEDEDLLHLKSFSIYLSKDFKIVTCRKAGSKLLESSLFMHSLPVFNVIHNPKDYEAIRRLCCFYELYNLQ